MKIIRIMTCTTGRRLKLTVPANVEQTAIPIDGLDDLYDAMQRASPAELENNTLHMDLVDAHGEVIKGEKPTEAEEREGIAELERLKLIPRELGEALRAAQLRRN